MNALIMQHPAIAHIITVAVTASGVLIWLKTQGVDGLANKLFAWEEKQARLLGANEEQLHKLLEEQADVLARLAEDAKKRAEAGKPQA